MTDCSLATYHRSMNANERLSPALCVDCGHPISERARRCRPCAARARAGAELDASPELVQTGSSISTLGPEALAWLRANGRRYNVARLAQVFGVPEEQIRWVLEEAGTA